MGICQAIAFWVDSPPRAPGWTGAPLPPLAARSTDPTVSSCLGAPAAASAGESGDRSEQRRMRRAGVGWGRERKAGENAEMGGGHE